MKSWISQDDRKCRVTDSHIDVVNALASFVTIVTIIFSISIHE